MWTQLSPFYNSLVKKHNESLGECVFSTSMGVRQGGATSCSMFTFFVDCIVDAVAASGPDGWLGNFHTLVQMDDTAIVATSHLKLIDKL